MADLVQQFATSVARHGDRIALINGDGSTVSFSQLDERVQELTSRWYAAGVRPKDRVLVAMRLDSDLYASLAALWSLGATVVFPEPAMGLAGVRHAVRTADVSAICTTGLFGLLKIIIPALWQKKHLTLGADERGEIPNIKIDETDIALISFTSGTSGNPKAIPRSHAFLMAQFKAVAPMLTSTRNERDLVSFPVFTLINLASGRTSVLPNWKMSRLASVPANTISNWIEKQGVTRALMPPSLCEKLSKNTMPTRLHTIFTGGGPVFPDLIDALQQKNPELRIVSVYGSTEAEPIAHLEAAEITRSDRLDMSSGQGLLVGRPVNDIKVRIVDDEIQVAGEHVNSGYLDPKQDAENKVLQDGLIWHRTGDAGRFDDQNRLWLWGRCESVLQVGDRTLFPFAAEVAARQWPGVKSCALMFVDDTAVLAIAGDRQYLADWQQFSTDIGVTKLVHLSAIPMDKRHASKVDRKALAGLIQS